jgi:phosphoglycolate phosphatase
MKESNHLPKKTLLFDLDGTILDTIPGITDSFHYAFNKLGITYPDSGIREFIGPPLAYSFSKIFTDEAEIKRGTETYREHYTTIGMYNCAPYEGVPEALLELKRRGYKLYVCTSKPTPLALVLLEKFDLLKLFIEVYGAEDDSQRGTKTGVLSYALSHSGEKKEDSLMIGDTLWDKEGADNNGVDFGAVLYGFGSRDTIDFPTNYFIVEKALDILNFLP